MIEAELSRTLYSGRYNGRHDFRYSGMCHRDVRSYLSVRFAQHEMMEATFSDAAGCVCMELDTYRSCALHSKIYYAGKVH